MTRPSVRPLFFGLASSPFLAASLAATLAACGDSTEPLRDAGPTDSGMVDTSTDAGIEADGGVDAGMDAGAADAGGGIDPAEEPYRTLLNNGLPSEKYDIVVVGDGYTQPELDGAYDDHVDHVFNRMFSRRSNGATEPFWQLRGVFNVHRVHLVSNDSGIDEEDMERDTALDGTDTCGQIGSVCFVDPAKVRAEVAAALEGSDIEPDLVVVVLNTEQPVEGVVEDGEGRIAVYGGGPTGDEDLGTSERGLRQIARAMAGLALTNPGAGAYNGGEPDAPNLTLSDTGAKWSEWVGFDEPNDDQSEVGAYEGGNGFATGIYRPVAESKLTGDYPAPFDPIAREAIFLSVFEKITPFGFTSDDTSVLEDPPAIYAVPNSANVVRVSWYVDGEVVIADGEPLEGDTFGFDNWAGANGISIGEHSVEARATVRTQYEFPDCRRCPSTDNVDFVRRTSDTLTQTVTYRVVKTR